MTYSELATFATKLVEVGILAANDDLMQLDIAVVAELHGEVGVFLVVEEAGPVSNTLGMYEISHTERSTWLQRSARYLGGGVYDLVCRWWCVGAQIR